MSMMRRRTIAIIAAALAIIMLGFALAGVLEYVETMEFVDVDGETKYYAKKTDGVYKLYAKGAKEPLKTVTYEEPDILGEIKKNTYYETALGTLVKLNESTGVAESYTPVITEGNEALGYNQSVLLFPNIPKENLLSIKLVNSDGSITFQRVNDDLEVDKDGKTFIIKESPFTAYDSESFTRLYVTAGKATASIKVKDPIKDENGEYSEYGLVPQRRTRYLFDKETGEQLFDKETGMALTEEYDYVPAYYVITDLNGTSHKVIIGDSLIAGTGYYAQYVKMDGDTETKWDAVYVMNNTLGASVLSTAEDYVTPLVCYPMSMSNYTSVQNFVIGNRVTDQLVDNVDDMYKKVISFSYIDLNDRQNTLAADVPYEFQLGLEGYGASDSAINGALYNLYQPSIVGTKLFAPSNEDLVEYGFFAPETNDDGSYVTNEKGEVQYGVFAKYVISYNYDILNEEHNAVEQTIHQRILISDVDYKETGNYYTYSMVYAVDEKGETELMQVYDFITEVEGNMFNFLRWDEYDWVNPVYIDRNIAFVTDIKITTKDYSASFKLDNSLSDLSGGVSSSNLVVRGEASDGKTTTSFGKMEVYDTNQKHLWVISSYGIKVYNYQTNKELQVNKDYTFYDYNDMDDQVYCRTGYIGDNEKCYIGKIVVNGQEIANAEGAKVGVSANYVTVLHKNNTKTEYLRYETDLFREFYRTLIYASLVGAYDLSEEEEAELINDPEKHLLTLEISLKDAESAGGTEIVDVYKFYRISSRKAYITVNGNGGFYVYSARIDKFVADAQRFFNKELIIPDAKN